MMSIRSVPDASEVSIGTWAPVSSDAAKEETRLTRSVAAHAAGKRAATAAICGPVKRA